jgi:spermidine/putrescine transport system permease protein
MAAAMATEASKGRWLTAGLLAPSSIWFLIMLVMPLVVVAIFSFGERAPAGGYTASFTFEQYANLPARLKAFQNTLTLAPLGTVLTLLVAYPLAYYLAVKAPSRWKLALLVLVIVPFWTSLLIRTYAWIFILGGRGIPTLLEFIGIEGVRLINTPTAVVIGIVYIYLPLMVFPIFVSLEKLDKRLLEASKDLGGSPFRTFLQITLPLSIPGMATGCMLVFILLMGEFLIPAILGGGKVFFIGNALVDLFLQSRNWPFGAAVATTLVIIMLVIVSIYMRLMMRVSAHRDATLFHSRVSVPVHSNRDHRPVQLQRGPARERAQGPFGQMAALALQRIKGPLKAIFDGMIYISIMIPGIVIGIATLVALVSVFDVLNPIIADVWLGDKAPKLELGMISVIAAHTLFTMSLVIVIVRARIAGMDRALIEASTDLYASPWATFRQVTLPQLAPAILAGFLLSFTFSFDDFIISFFVAGPNTTLPIYVFSSIRRGITPEVNAIGAMVMGASLAS